MFSTYNSVIYIKSNNIEWISEIVSIGFGLNEIICVKYLLLVKLSSRQQQQQQNAGSC